MSEKFVKMEIDIANQLDADELALYFWIKVAVFNQNSKFEQYRYKHSAYFQERTGWSRRKFFMVLKRLKDKGLIETQTVTTSFGTAQKYLINDKGSANIDTGGSAKLDTPPPLPRAKNDMGGSAKNDTLIIDSTIIDNTNYTKLKELEKYYLLCKNQHRDKVSDKLLIDTLETYGEETVLSIIDYYNRNYDATICKIYYMFKSERQVLRTLSDINKEKMKTKNKQNIKYTDEYIELLEKEVNKKC